jgi:hypothetical protein
MFIRTESPKPANEHPHHFQMLRAHLGTLWRRITDRCTEHTAGRLPLRYQAVTRKKNKTRPYCSKGLVHASLGRSIVPVSVVVKTDERSDRELGLESWEWVTMPHRAPSVPAVPMHATDARDMTSLPSQI